MSEHFVIQGQQSVPLFNRPSIVTNFGMSPIQPSVTAASPLMTKANQEIQQRLAHQISQSPQPTTTVLRNQQPAQKIFKFDPITTAQYVPSVPPQTQSLQMQAALQDCITNLQHVYVQRFSIINAKSQQNSTEQPAGDQDRALDQAFATSHSQLLGSISTLQKRLLVIQSGSMSPSLASVNGMSPGQIQMSLFGSTGAHSPIPSPPQLMIPTPRQASQGSFSGIPNASQNKLENHPSSENNSTIVKNTNQPDGPQQVSKAPTPPQVIVNANGPFNNQEGTFMPTVSKISQTFAVVDQDQLAMQAQLANGAHQAVDETLSEQSPAKITLRPEDNSEIEMVPSEHQMRAHAQVIQRVPILKKAIKKRVRNRYGPDPSYMGFEKHYMVNESTGRANQLFRCLKCHIQTPKLCNMIDHQKTHRQEKSYKCPHCRHAFIQAGNRDRHYMSGACMIEGNKTQCPLILDDQRQANARLGMAENM